MDTHTILFYGEMKEIKTKLYYPRILLTTLSVKYVFIIDGNPIRLYTKLKK